MRTRSMSGPTGMVLAGALVSAVTVTTVVLRAQVITEPLTTLQTLKGVAVPEPPNLADFVVDREAAIVLGKALFWDMNAGSDETQACASCHFHAGTDSRFKNQINPNGANTVAALGQIFDPTASGGKGGPNYTLTPGDFPFHQLSDPSNRDSFVLFSSNDVAGSQGVQAMTFNYVYQGAEGTSNAESLFHVGDNFDTHQHVRQATGRNAPTTINAAFNFRNFWDGRANNVFNGQTPVGPHDPGAHIWVTQANGSVLPVSIALVNASAASQSVGPILSDVEMSAAGRSFPDVGLKLEGKRALAKQQVDPTDSVLGPYVYRNAAGAVGNGLTLTYKQLIQKAFAPKYWNANTTKFRNTSGSTYTQMEENFSLFWGLSIMMYESTLVSDDARFDRWATGQTSALTTQELEGMEIFRGQGRCAQCHKGPEFTSAATNLQLEAREGRLVERMVMNDGQIAIYDQGFYNIGVTPTANDLGNGGVDGSGQPWSLSRQYVMALNGLEVPDMVSVNTCGFAVLPCFPIAVDARVAVDGAFKVPTLRNVEFTGPYFHNGGYSTLESVVDFYNRGGNRQLTASGDTSGFGDGLGRFSNLDFDIMPLGLSDSQKAALVAFLKTLSDDRVKWEMAPFDHPSLKIANGHVGDEYQTEINSDGTAKDSLVTLPAVGAAGRGAKGLGPIVPFTPQQ